jgi:hypothetical protein
MDLAAIVISAIIIIILQVVSIILIAAGRKPSAKPETAGPVPVNNDTRDLSRKRRDEGHFTRRSQNDQRPKPFVPPQQPQSVDPVEKSLRDINLRLKNAERDQENARKNIRDGIQVPQGSQGPQNPQRRSDQNNSRPNRGRDDDFRRRDNRDRDRNGHNRQGGHTRDRNNDLYRTPSNVVAPAPVQPPVAQMQPAISLAAEIAVRPQTIPIPRPVAPVIAKESLSVVPENTEVLHGRKVLVRRRIVTPEEQAKENAAAPAASAPAATQPQIGAVAAPVAEARDAREKPADSTAVSEGEVQPINFGR